MPVYLRCEYNKHQTGEDTSPFLKISGRNLDIPRSVLSEGVLVNTWWPTPCLVYNSPMLEWNPSYCSQTGNSSSLLRLHHVPCTSPFKKLTLEYVSGPLDAELFLSQNSTATIKVSVGQASRGCSECCWLCVWGGVPESLMLEQSSSAARTQRTAWSTQSLETEPLFKSNTIDV